MKNVYELLGNIDGFLKRVLDSLGSDGIDVSDFELDHICYRVESEDEYKKLQLELSQLGKLLTEAEIGGRPISTYKLKKPVVFGERKIYLIELPSPKKGSLYPRGLEHVEFVISLDFPEFMSQYPNVNFDTEGIMKKISPDIKIKYPEFVVKFHQKSLEQVIKLEQ